MTDRLTRREREALLADAAPEVLTDENAADVALLAELLAAPAAWAEPGAALEDSVVQAVTTAAPEPSVVTPLRPGVARRRRTRPWVLGVAAAAVAVVALAAGLTIT